MSELPNSSEPPAVKATVIEELPNRLYELETEDGRRLKAGPSEEAKRLGMDIRKGKRVWVRPARLDPGRGVITGTSGD
jgi:translation initiation factor IF-1